MKTKNCCNVDVCTPGETVAVPSGSRIFICLCVVGRRRRRRHFKLYQSGGKVSPVSPGERHNTRWRPHPGKGMRPITPNRLRNSGRDIATSALQILINWIMKWNCTSQRFMIEKERDDVTSKNWTKDFPWFYTTLISEFKHRVILILNWS